MMAVAKPLLLVCIALARPSWSSQTGAIPISPAIDDLPPVLADILAI
jgi:hypothetical protein